MINDKWKKGKIIFKKMEKSGILKFDISNCKESLCCNGCDIEEYDVSIFNKYSNNTFIHNQDVIYYNEVLSSLPRKYYEIFSVYDHSLIGEDFLPASHHIMIDQYLTIDEVSDTLSCYACGGAGFIAFKVVDSKRSPICTNGWKGFEKNGWI